MFEKLELTRMAQALAAHSGARLGLLAQNVANADTPGFKARDLPDFAQTYGDSPLTTTRPTHLTARATSATAERIAGAADPNGNTVSLEDQMLRMADVRQSHEMALAVYRSTSGIVRAALGRGGQ
jgi:flagellar basal-body rod protein FlgB